MRQTSELRLLRENEAEEKQRAMRNEEGHEEQGSGEGEDRMDLS